MSAGKIFPKAIQHWKSYCHWHKISHNISLQKNWLWSYKIQVTAKQQFGLSTEQLFILATSDIAIKAPILHATWTLKDNLKSPKTN